MHLFTKKIIPKTTNQIRIFRQPKRIRYLIYINHLLYSWRINEQCFQSKCHRIQSHQEFFLYISFLQSIYTLVCAEKADYRVKKIDNKGEYLFKHSKAQSLIY